MLQRLQKFLKLFLVLLALPLCFSDAETEVKWTPNEKDGEGPLPLSMRQRQQLVQLEQAIASSPNPQATLQQVAQSNQMDPRDLLRMLERNRADLQATGEYDRLLTTSNPRKSNLLLQLMSTLTVGLVQAARKHPQTFALVCFSVMLTAYVAWSAPRTGLCLSSSRKFSGLVSKGPTTIWKPPASFCREQFLDQNRLWKHPTINPKRHKGNNNDDEEEDSDSEVNDLHQGAVQALWEDVTTSDKSNNVLEEGYYQWLDRKTLRRCAPDLQHVALGQATLRLSELGATTPSRRGTATTNDNDSGDKRNDASSSATSSWSTGTSASNRAESIAASISLQHARDLLEEQQLTEFSNQLQYYSNSAERRGLLVVPGMGDWNRMGLLPLYVARQPDGDDEEQESSRQLQLVLTTLPGYHWEGEIHIDISLQNDSMDDRDDDEGGEEEEDTLLVLRVALVIPRKMRSIPQSVAQTVVTSLLQSLSTSLRTRTQLSLSRQSQSSTFSQQAHAHAGKRRHSRFQKQQELEEMAADRRRRWQRQNPNSGHYRPSGDRMKSPNNAVYH